MSRTTADPVMYRSVIETETVAETGIFSTRPWSTKLMPTLQSWTGAGLSNTSVHYRVCGGSQGIGLFWARMNESREGKAPFSSSRRNNSPSVSWKSQQLRQRPLTLTLPSLSEWHWHIYLFVFGRLSRHTCFSAPDSQSRQLSKL